jgi:hypothetical protein
MERGGRSENGAGEERKNPKSGVWGRMFIRGRPAARLRGVAVGWVLDLAQIC